MLDTLTSDQAQMRQHIHRLTNTAISVDAILAFEHLDPARRDIVLEGHDDNDVPILDAVAHINTEHNVDEATAHEAPAHEAPRADEAAFINALAPINAEHDVDDATAYKAPRTDKAAVE
jgi:hypothetical protein